MYRSRLAIALLMQSACLLPQAAWAQADNPIPAPPPPPAVLSYTPADFARFSPRTAYDLVFQVPGFTIKEADQERGLGQASENVIINGVRITNKSGGAVDELRRIAASDVERMDLVDAASLGIAGLSGQIVNVIVKQQRKGGGQFEWRPDFRAHYSKPNLFRGQISYTGSKGPIEYTALIKDQAGRGAFGGPVLITEASGALRETREQRFHSESDLVTFQGQVSYKPASGTVANLTVSGTPYWAPTTVRERRVRTDGDNRTRSTDTELDGFYYDINGDVAFAAGPGRLKLIGLRHWDDEPVVTTQITDFDANRPDEGVRFTRHSYIEETIGRAEYAWKTGANDWQVTLERAYNALDQRGGLEQLSPTGKFEVVPFPDGSGKVQETRYEGVGTLSRPLGSKLDLQVAAGGEYSMLERVDGNVPARKFFRPKGSVNLSWRPAATWDASLKLSRKVGQISFYDFLSQPNLQAEREVDGNPDLVPPQSWEVEAEVGKQFGAWGKTRLRGYHHRIEDIIDIIPIGLTGEGVGNLPHATRLGLESVSTIQFDPVGWKGAKLDLTAGFENTKVKDPLTGRPRPIGGTRDLWLESELRHDVPGTPLAWGAVAEYNHYDRNYYLTEVFRSWEGPWFVGFYVEHKDVFGLTVRAQMNNVLNGRHLQDRYVYTGRRTTSLLDYHQVNDQLIGPIFQFTVKGAL